MKALRIWLLFGCLAGCSWLVDPNGHAMRCSTDTDKTPCPSGYECRGGLCQHACGEEICGNSLDDDCDDKIDEQDPSVPDKCGDQIDNDCDGKVDEQDSSAVDKCGDQIDNDCDNKVDEDPDDKRPDICGNAQDDDCDGMVDEGFDQDKDGDQWCGDTTKPDGKKLADCDDYNPKIYYGAPEVCDGVDDDCDNKIDEGSTLCDSGEECVGQRCVVPSCAIEGSSKQCASTEMCDLDTGKCVPKGCSDESCRASMGATYHCDQTSGTCRIDKRDDGDECVAHEDCKSGSCSDAAALRLTANVARVCTHACCSDADCGEAELCFVSGSGARSCLPVTKATQPSGGANCTDDSQCTGADVCAVVFGQHLASGTTAARNDLVSTVCAVPQGLQPLGSSCDDNDSACSSNACVQSGPTDLGAIQRCSTPCRTTDDCAALVRYGAGGSGSYCRFLGTAVDNTEVGDYVPVCVIDHFESGTGLFGQACTRSSDCADSACIRSADGSGTYCATTCCTDAQCNGEGSAHHCRPIALADHYEMRCVK